MRALKKELQKEGVFRLAKARKTFKNSHELKQERMVEIVRRKIKDKHETKANSAYRGVNEQKPKPFVFKIYGYTAKIYNDGRVMVYEKNKKVNETMLDKINFDNINELLGTTIKTKKEVSE